MGAIGGEELMKWEKMQGQNGNEEKILVLVRLRPLNDKEIAKNEVSDWECINETTILYRNSLQERSGLPTIYSFDRVYRGDCSTREVYEEGARGIALSVVTGINSTIFAYGQTSSGKTYTMNGITEYTVDDIYDYIQRHEERAFVLKFSAMEIYNEVLRDLLSTDNSSLRILDDPERGTIVEKLTEETLRDKNHLKELLSICEAQRQVGETSLNETSSRSHQILRLTIESSAREFLGKDNSTALASSVNFVDLAGSERASQASSVGQRLKEGCHINRSLLTLGTVIRKLSKGRQGHINYRDSKLTRILQPSLGGNARTAIICTLSPARTHVEQSRNTLLFASCAKEVSTNAHVNVVMSDKALVKQLQKELARLESELRNPGHPGDYPALLRKKDLQIEKLEREVKELTKQRDLAQSRIEDLLQTVRDDQVSNQWQDGLDLNSKSNEEHLSEDTGSLDDSSPPPRQPSGTHIDDICKEVRCIETDESPKTPKAATSLHQQNGLTNSDVGQQVNVFQNTVNSPLSPYPNEPSSPFRSFTRSLSCRANLMTDLNDYSTEKRAETTTPPNDLEREYPGRPEERIRRKHWGVPPLIFGANSYKLSRNNSQSSNGSSFIDELKSQNSVNGDEEILSVDTFVAGLKEMAKLHQVEETESKDGKSVKDIGVGTMPYDSLPEASSNWPLEFEKMRKLIIELWHTCNVSLIHRTYFFILFKGDPTDSIYMEVELRRLLYLKEAFSKGGPVVQNGQKLTLESSLKTLKREREMLSRLMYKRFTEDERNKLYKKWAVNLNSKQRKLQLINLLWSYTVDINHVTESASIVAKLIRFSQHGPALKETFGISFTPPRARRSFGWKN